MLAKTKPSLLERMLCIFAMMMIAVDYDPTNMIFLGCMVAFLLVVFADSIRIAKKNRGHILQSFVSYRVHIISIIFFVISIIFDLFQHIIPEAAYPYIAWSAFCTGLGLLVYWLIRD